MSARVVCASVGALAALIVWPSARPAESDARWSVRLGYAQASFDTDSSISLAGQPAPGATVTVDDQTVLLGDVRFAFNDRWTARLAVGLPIDLSVAAGGSLKALSPPLSGTLGEIQVAPIVVSALYAPRSFGRFKPYVPVLFAIAPLKPYRPRRGEEPTMTSRATPGSARASGAPSSARVVENYFFAFMDGDLRQ